MWTLVVEDSDSILTNCDLLNDGLLRECWECRIIAPDGREWEVDVDKYLAVDIIYADCDFDLADWAS